MNEPIRRYYDKSVGHWVEVYAEGASGIPKESLWSGNVLILGTAGIAGIEHESDDD